MPEDSIDVDSLPTAALTLVCLALLPIAILACMGLFHVLTHIDKLWMAFQTHQYQDPPLLVAAACAFSPACTLLCLDFSARSQRKNAHEQLLKHALGGGCLADRRGKLLKERLLLNNTQRGILLFTGLSIFSYLLLIALIGNPVQPHYPADPNPFA